MLEKTARISSIIQGVAAVVFLYSYFFPATQQTADPNVVHQMNHPSWLAMVSVIFLAVAVLASSVLNLVALRSHRKTNVEKPLTTKPTIGLTLRSASIGPYQHNPNSWYPRQMALYFSNDGGEIHLGVGKWIKDNIGMQIGRPSRFVYFRKNNLGRWEGEATDKVVYSGNWVKISVGLDSSVPDGELKKLADEIQLGTLEIPAVVSGAPIKIRTNIVVTREVLSRL